MHAVRTEKEEQIQRLKEELAHEQTEFESQSI